MASTGTPMLRKLPATAPAASKENCAPSSKESENVMAVRDKASVKKQGTQIEAAGKGNEKESEKEAAAKENEKRAAGAAGKEKEKEDDLRDEGWVPMHFVPIICTCGREIQSAATSFEYDLMRGKTEAEALARCGLPLHLPHGGDDANVSSLCCRAKILSTRAGIERRLLFRRARLVASVTFDD
jgi:DNA-directed RNA polymerase subunit N (RpoN/RPB10)